MNGRQAKRLRKEGVLPRKQVEFVPSDESAPDYKFDKKLYRERRDRGLSGTPQAVTIHQPAHDEKGKRIGQVPLGNKLGVAGSSRQSRALRPKERKFTKKGHANFVQKHMAAKARGE